MTRISKLHIILVLITLMVSVLKGQTGYNPNSALPSVIPLIPNEYKLDNLRLDKHNVITEIIPYRIVPSDNPLYGCWSELDVIWPDYLSLENRDKLSITIINQELHQDIPDYVEIGNKHYYMMKLPLNHWWKD